MNELSPSEVVIAEIARPMQIPNLVIPRRRGASREDAGSMGINLHISRVDGRLKMWRDLIVEETRKRRDENATEFNHNLDAIFDDIRKRQREAGKRLVSFPTRKPLQKPSAA